MTVEFRAWMPDDAEVRAEGDGMSFTGYAIRWDVPSEPLPFTERIAPGATTRSLKSRNEVKAFVNHDTNLVIGSSRAGTLRMQEDSKGLLTQIDLPDTSYARDLSVSIQRGDVSGMSFGFSVVKDEWSADYGQRTINELRLHEVSVVTGFPAYRQTTAAVRSMPLLAKRTGLALDALTDAVSALESGADLSQDQFDVLAEALDRSRPNKAEAAPEPDLSDLLALKSALLAKAVED